MAQKSDVWRQSSETPLNTPPGKNMHLSALYSAQTGDLPDPVRQPLAIQPDPITICDELPPELGGALGEAFDAVEDPTDDDGVSVLRVTVAQEGDVPGLQHVQVTRLQLHHP